MKLHEMIDKLVVKRKETRKVMMKEVLGDMEHLENMSDEEFKFMKAVLELERMTDEMLCRASMEIEELRYEVDKLSESLQKERAE